MFFISQGYIIYSMLCQPVVGCLVQNDVKPSKINNGLTLMIGVRAGGPRIGPIKVCVHAYIILLLI